MNHETVLMPSLIVAFLNYWGLTALYGSDQWQKVTFGPDPLFFLMEKMKDVTKVTTHDLETVSEIMEIHVSPTEYSKFVPNWILFYIVQLFVIISLFSVI